MRAHRLFKAATRGKRGFTLIELMVALTMGLIVGVAVVGLARDVTTTFHDEGRVVAAESGLRVAMDRLRADVARASMMSSPSVVVDKSAEIHATSSDMVNYQAGLRVFTGGSLASSFMGVTPNPTEGGVATLPSDNGLNPDAIDITGNLSPLGDYYSSQSFASTVTGLCSGTQINLALTDAIYRLVPAGGLGVSANQSALDVNLRRAFFPNATSTTRTIAGSKFMARIIDRASPIVPTPSQYVTVCDAGYDGNNPYVVVDTSSVIDAKGAGTMLNAGDHMMINPVLTVRWRIVPSSGVLNPTSDPLKYDLLRTFVDVSGNEVGGSDSATGEIVAEYIVDMKFTETVDETPAAASSDAGAAPQPTLLVSLPFDNTANWAGKTSAVTAGAALSPPAPQRVRSVGIRLAARTAVADRTVALPSEAGANYLYRYQLDAGYARVRTLMSEVSLQNQLNVTYP